MQIAILTIFPQMFEPLINESITGRANKNGLLNIETIDIRSYSTKKHKNTDDYPFGGGAGMLMTCQPISDALKGAKAKGYNGKRIYMGAKGRKLDQNLARELAREDNLTILCGHYEGVDERIIECEIDMEVSIGDYILTGGELPAMVLIDCLSRFIPGILGSSESTVEESFSENLLEYPQYTRPQNFEGMEVPEVLLSGNHAKIEKWRRENSLKTTLKHRPDLLDKAELNKKDLEYIENLKKFEGGKDET